MSAAGLFCSMCGSIFDLPDTDQILCDGCGFETCYTDLGSLEVTTSSAPKAIPKWLRQLEDTTDEKTGRVQRATVEEPCPKCGHMELSFYTMQLRSADEGQTVF
ncbi:unnamed protein product, partial [Heterosigma akashiwo]